MKAAILALAAGLAILPGLAAAQVPETVQERQGLTVQNPFGPGVMTADQADRLIGTRAVDSQGRQVGSVDNLLVDAEGRVRAVVLEWGGLLGLGERRAVVPWEEVRFRDDRAAVDLTREQLENLPVYDADVPALAGVGHDLKALR